MKLVWNLVALLVVLAVALPFLAETRTEDGDAPDSTGRKADASPSFWSSVVPKLTGQAEEKPAEEVSLYRWRDADGSVHIESYPPPPGTRAEIIRVEKPAKTTAVPEEQAPAPRQPKSDTGLTRNPLSIYTPAGAEELLERVDDTLKLLEDRRKDLEEMKDQL